MGRRSLQAAILALSLALGLGAVETAMAQQTGNGVTAELQVSPRLPASDDPIRLSAAITWIGCPIEFQAPVPVGGQYVIEAAPPDPVLHPCSAGPNPVTYRYSTTLPPLAHGAYKVVVYFQGTEVAALAFTVSYPEVSLFLLPGGRFQATLRRADGGRVGSVALTGQAGYFWFFDSDNAEATIKILDGRALNGHFWVFIASMTDVPFTLTITDLAGASCQQRNCPQRVYTSPAGKNTNFIDVTAF